MELYMKNFILSRTVIMVFELLLVFVQLDMVAQVNLTPITNTEALLKTPCTKEYNRDCFNIIQSFKGKKSVAFIQDATEYMHLAKQAVDTANRIAQIERTYLDITAVAILMKPLRTYKDCLLKLQAPISE